VHRAERLRAARRRACRCRNWLQCLTRQPYGNPTRPVGALLALGQQEIGRIGAPHSQNHRLPQRYVDMLAGRAACHSGAACTRSVLSHNDLVRRMAILSPSVNLFVDIGATETVCGIDSRSVFGAAWTELRRFERSVLLTLTGRT
jgi:hypothetical protein